MEVSFVAQGVNVTFNVRKKMARNISVDDFEIFKEALTEENLELQVIIVQKLESLAKALGEKSTREELIPFIDLHYIELHDEVQFNLAEQLKNFVPLVGGLEHASTLFDIFGRLCMTDEPLVRDKAIKTLIYIQKDLDTEQTEKYMFPIINDLLINDWFTSKCSAVALFAPFYLKLSDDKKAEIRNNFKMLIQDDAPMVRKAAAYACIDMVAVVEEKYLKTEFVPICQDIGQDPQDSVRSMTIDIVLALLKRLNSNEVEESIFKIIETAGDDVSWRLRQRLANNIAYLQQQIPQGKYRGKLLALYQKLAQDMEAEVRILAASNLCNYCCYLKESYSTQPESENNFEPVFEESIMTTIKKLALDECEDVRFALSSNILPLSSLLSENCFKKNIVSFLLHILDKEESIAIQANFLLGLSSLSNNVDLSQSLDALKNVVRAVIVRSQSKWRTRRSMLMTFVDIAKFCTADYFSDNFKIYYAALLGDSVFAVRRSASLILPILSKYYGIKWASEHLVPYFTMFARDSRYLYRFVPLYGINEMINPHLCIHPDTYLGDFKKFVESTESPNNKKVIVTVVKIIKTSHLVQKELKEELYSSILKLKDDLNYLSNCCDSHIYSENDFEKLKNKSKSINVYSVEEKDLEADNWCYLQGLLGLIYNKFLPIIQTLNKDRTENIQIRAICTLAEIYNFIAKITKEESEEWIQKCLNSVTPEEMTKIIDDIHQEFKTADFQDEELIDTSLMDASDDVSLKKSITVNNSNSEKESLVQEVMEILDKKISEYNMEEEVKHSADVTVKSDVEGTSDVSDASKSSSQDTS